MTPSASFFGPQQTDFSDASSPSFYHGKKSMDLEEWEEHPLMSNIRNTITAHRLQSPAHFDLTIEVKQVFRTKRTHLMRGFKLNVAFCGYLATDYYICRAAIRKDPETKTRVATREVQIFDATSNSFVSLNTFLAAKYPTYPDSVGAREMRAWWAGNGKVFDWMSLPTELKEQIIRHCLDQSTSNRTYQQRRKYDRHSFSHLGVYEIVERLTHWTALLQASHQMRAITLRLFVAGISGLKVPCGFGIQAHSCRGLFSVLDRLGRHYQMVESNSLPTDYETQAHAECYYHHPRIHPHLKQYATFRHGIRHIDLEMDFVNYMHFFKVTVGGFGRYLDPGAISYEVFEQLPHLHRIALRLPRRPRQGWVDSPFQNSPQLFHIDFPCARALHRVIYERIARALTLYPNVEVKGFGDENEKNRFYTLRQASIENSKWTAADYEELYEECGGGIELGEMIHPGSWLEGEEEQQQVVWVMAEAGSEASSAAAADAFFPPKCRCDTRCHMLYLEVEQRRVRRR